MRGEENRGFLPRPPHVMHMLHCETCSNCSQSPSSEAKAQERSCKQLRLRNISNLFELRSMVTEEAAKDSWHSSPLEEDSAARSPCF